MVLDTIFFFSRKGRHTILQGDWSPDVSSSDLPPPETAPVVLATAAEPARPEPPLAELLGTPGVHTDKTTAFLKLYARWHEIGRASCREKCRSRWSPYH